MSRLRDGRYKVDYGRRDGQPGTPMASGVIILDQHPDITGGKARGRHGQPGQYWELRELPHVQAAFGRPVRALSGTTWRLDKAALPPWATAEDHRAAQRQHELCERIWWAWQQEGAGVEQYVEEVLWTTLVCGFAWFELVADPHPIALPSVGYPMPYLIPRLPAWRAPWTVEYWLTDREELIGLSSSFWAATDYGGTMGRPQVVLPREKILHVANEQIGSNFEGRSALRSVYNFLLMLRQAYKLQALAVEVNSLGELWFKLDPTSNLSPTEKSWLERYIKTRKAEHVPGGILPAGVTVEYGSPKDRMPDMTAVIEGLERCVAMGLDAEDRLIALNSAGSYAAKEVATDESRSSFNGIAGRFVRRPLEEVLRRFIRLNFPRDAAAGRVYVPRIEHGEVEQRDTEKWLASVIMATESGLVDHPEFGDLVREELQLPEMTTEEAEEAEIAPEAGLDPAEAITAARLGGLLTTPETIAWARAIIGMPRMTEEERGLVVASLRAESDLAAEPIDDTPDADLDEEPDIDHLGGTWLTPAEIAERWKVSPSTVTTWIKLGKVQGRKIGSRWRANAESVAAFIADEAHDDATTPEEVDP